MKFRKSSIIKATATDAAGNTGTRTFSLEVVALPDTEDPVVSITHNAPSTMYPGQVVDFTVTADDNVGVTSLEFTINGEKVTIAPDGKVSFTFADVGIYTIKAIATDAAGNTDTKTFTLEVIAQPDTEDPVVDITHNAPSMMYPGQTVDFTITADDNTGITSLEFTVNGQKITLDLNGKASFTFAAVGVYTIKAIATDAAGNTGTKTFSLEVIAQPDTEDPVVSLTHNAPSTMYPGQVVDFTVTADDNTGVTSLEFTINGQKIALDPNGKASFTFAAVGVYTIKAIATDAAGNTDEQTLRFEVLALPDTEDPVVTITHDAASPIRAGQTVEFTVLADDNIGVTSLDFTINSQKVPVGPDGKVSFTFLTAGSYEIKGVATDAAGNVGTRVFSIEVAEAADTTPPTVDLTASTPGIINPGQTVDFTIDARDNVGVETIELTVNGQKITVANGKASFTFTAVGAYTIVATATDAAGNAGTKTITITVVEKAAEPDFDNPTLTLTHNQSSTTVKEGASATFTVAATDNVGVVRTTLTVNGEEIPLDANGKAQFTFGGAGIYVVIAKAYDAAGNESVKTEVFNVPAFVDTERPVVDFTHDMTDPLDMQVGQTVRFKVTATDNIGVTRIIITITLMTRRPTDEKYVKIVEVDADGYATVVLEREGVFLVEAQAWDAAGNSDYAYDMYDMEVWDDGILTEAPSITLNGHLGQEGKDGARIEQSTDVIATITGDVASWQVILTDNKTGATRIIGSGSGATTAATLTRLDPTALANGSYSVTVRATNSEGVSSETTRQITIASAVKLGNFELPFQDLNLSVGGFTIPVNRVYDTLTNGYSGDFGYGWNLGTLPISLAVNNPINHQMYGGNFMMNFPESGWTNDTVVSVTLADGSIAQFEIMLMPDYYDPWSGWQTYTMTLQCVSGQKLSLEIKGVTNYHAEAGFHVEPGSNGESYIFSVGEAGFFNPTRILGGGQKITYELTMEDGTIYVIDPATGMANGMRSADGKSVEITSDGVIAYNSDGSVLEEVKFVRDDLGRITHIVDPSGSTVAYEYDANGDLTSMTKGGQKVSYEYVTDPGAPAHYLQTIRDNSGKVILNVNYDLTTGRIKDITDANGNKTTVDYTLQTSTGESVEKVTDASGLTTEAVLNANGNAIRTIQTIPDPSYPNDASRASYMISIADYDNKGNCLGTARTFTITAAQLTALGTDRFTYWPDDIIWEQLNTYDQYGHRITSTDVYGKTTTYEYDKLGNVIKTTDPRGSVTETEYDEIGRVIKTTDAQGNVTEYEYNVGGQIGWMYYTPKNGATQTLRTMTYDSMGRLTSTIDQNGLETRYTYDAAGRQISTIQYNTDSNGVSHSTETLNDYNAAGQQIAESYYIDDELVEYTRYEYDANGQMTASVDINGLRTEYTYDNKGQATEIREQVIDSDGVVQWLVTRTVYDAMGRVVCETQSQLLDNPTDTTPGKATFTEYDILGRVVRTEERKSVSLTRNADGTFTVAIKGTVVSYTAKGYNGAGRTDWTENANGVKTFYYYTREGKLSHTMVDLDGNLATTHDQTTSGKTVYDEYGRQVESITDKDGNLTTTGDQSATKYTYDEYGRVIRTDYADGTSTSITYDSQGRKVSETDQLNRTTYYEYNEQGRLAAVVLPQVKHPTTGQMVHVRYEYSYDARGKMTSLRDNIYQTDPTNAATIDDSAARTTTYTYDWMGNQTSRTLPEGQTEYFFHNEKGQTIRHVSFEGRVTVYEYDQYDRLAKKSYYSTEAAWNNGIGLSGHTISYTYDSLGRATLEVDSRQGLTYTTYNEDGQVTRVNSPTSIINYEYDAITGQVTRTWTGTNSASPVTDVRNTYDEQGRLKTVETYAREGAALTNPEVSKYVYDALGNMSKILHSNGIITTYDYDLMNRLREVLHTHDNGTPNNEADDVMVEQFVYEYHNDGNKSGETATDKDGNTNTWNWDYDALGRLVEERHDNHKNDLDYTTGYVYDLVGNRLEKNTTNADGNEQIKSSFDANDRLLNETTLLNNVETKKTDYEYKANGTEQTGKTITDLLNSRIESKTEMEYNEQGRLFQITISTYVDGVLSKKVTQTYEYDSSGIKVRQIESVDADGDGTIDSTKDTKYVNDKQNHTGYSQVLEERTSEDGGPVKVTTYTIGHDVLNQYDAVNGLLTLLTDGHLSTRAIADALGQILQQYNYDAYGNAVGFDPAEALTNLLYSGEEFNPVSGLQYLRARWYNPQSGTFNRLDPFSGSQQSPLSFHKYAYGHNNPVLNLDPSGNSPLLMTVMIALEYLAMTALMFNAAQLAVHTVLMMNHFTWLMSAIYRHDLDDAKGYALAMLRDGAQATIAGIGVATHLLMAPSGSVLKGLYGLGGSFRIAGAGGGAAYLAQAVSVPAVATYVAGVVTPLVLNIMFKVHGKRYSDSYGDNPNEYPG